MKPHRLNLAMTLFAPLLLLGAATSLSGQSTDPVDDRAGERVIVVKATAKVKPFDPSKALPRAFQVAARKQKLQSIVEQATTERKRIQKITELLQDARGEQARELFEEAASLAAVIEKKKQSIAAAFPEQYHKKDRIRRIVWDLDAVISTLVGRSAPITPADLISPNPKRINFDYEFELLTPKTIDQRFSEADINNKLFPEGFVLTMGAGLQPPWDQIPVSDPDAIPLRSFYATKASTKLDSNLVRVKAPGGFVLEQKLSMAESSVLHVTLPLALAVRVQIPKRPGDLAPDESFLMGPVLLTYDQASERVYRPTAKTEPDFSKLKFQSEPPTIRRW